MYKMQILLFTFPFIPANKGDNRSPAVALTGVLAGVGGAEHAISDFTIVIGIAYCVGYDGHICLRINVMYLLGDILRIGRFFKYGVLKNFKSQNFLNRTS